MLDRFSLFAGQRSYLWLVICSLLTLLAVAGYGWLPDRVISVYPGDDWAAYIYADAYDGGNSQVEWLNYPEPAWRCTIAPGVEHPYCGFHVDMGVDHGPGVDMSGMRKVRLHMDYTGAADRLRIYLRNHEPAISEPGELETAKFINARIATTHLAEPVEVGFDEFFVAEWWISEYDVPREHVAPRFDRVVAFGVDLASPAPHGEHELAIRQLEFVGDWVSAERWYLGILLFWVLVVMGLGSYQLLLLHRRVRRERRRLGAMSDRNRQLLRQTQKYRTLSRTDQLTGLLNRHGLAEHLERYFPEGTDEPGGVSVLVMDLDHFKQANDRLGHEAGDQVLVQLAGILSENARETDVVCRWGGEEFLLLLPYTHLEAARAMSEKLRSLVANTRFADYPDLQVTLSAGIAARRPGEPFHETFSRADFALYQAKAQGRNRTVLS